MRYHNVALGNLLFPGYLFEYRSRFLLPALVIIGSRCLPGPSGFIMPRAPGLSAAGACSFVRSSVHKSLPTQPAPAQSSPIPKIIFFFRRKRRGQKSIMIIQPIAQYPIKVTVQGIQAIKCNFFLSFLFIPSLTTGFRINRYGPNCKCMAPLPVSALHQASCCTLTALHLVLFFFPFPFQATPGKKGRIILQG